jgi:hypothetical protein
MDNLIIYIRKITRQLAKLQRFSTLLPIFYPAAANYTAKSCLLPFPLSYSCG